MEVTSVTLALQRHSELCIRVPWTEPEDLDSNVHLLSREGESFVEVNGAPLRNSVRYELLPGSQHRITCWSASALLCIEGSSQLLENVFQCRSKASAVAEYHCLVNDFRGSENPPVILVCGRADSGKTSFALSLVNYAVRFGWTPLLVDLDPSCRQCVSLPGSIGAAVIESPVVLDEDVISHQLSTHFFVGNDQVQSKDCDSKGVSDVWIHFMRTQCEMAQKIRSPQVHASGSIVIAPELRGLEGAKVVEDIIDRCGATHVVCLHDDSLFEVVSSILMANEPRELSTVAATLHPNGRRSFSTRTRTVFVDTLNVPLQPISSAGMARLSKSKLNRYFHGVGSSRINAFVFDKISLNNVSVYRIISRDGKVAATAVERSQLESTVRCIAAILDPSQTRRDVGGFLSCSVAGFACVQGVDGQEMSILTNLAKNALPLGRLTIVVGDIQLFS